MPGVSYDTPQTSFTPVTPALECANRIFSLSDDIKGTSPFIIYVDGFLDGTIPNSNSSINGPLGDFFDREFSRALIKSAPPGKIHVMYVTPDAIPTSSKYDVDMPTYNTLMIERNAIVSSIPEAMVLAIRGVFTQADEKDSSQRGYALDGRLRGGDYSVNPSFGESSSFKTLALTLDISNLENRFIDASNTFVTSVSAGRSEASLSVNVFDAGLGFTFQDEISSSIQSNQRTLVEAGVFWLYTVLYPDIGLEACLQRNGLKPGDQVAAANEWNNMDDFTKRSSMIKLLREGKFYIDGQTEYEEAIQKASEYFRRTGMNSFDYNENNLGILYLRLKAALGATP
jgi:hypothetical protein